MYDQDVRLEALSAILGTPVKPLRDIPDKTRGHQLTVDDFLLATILGNGNRLDQLDFSPTTDYNESFSIADMMRTLHDIIIRGEIFIDEREFFDPKFDCDFTKRYKSERCFRGNERYKRPRGWYRMALKVLDKYPGKNTWLGTNGWRSHSVPGEWPVSYHGTSLDGAKGIITSHYKAGSRDRFGRGIYSTPDIHVAEDERYAKTFRSKKTGRKYRVVAQNRINPEERVECNRKDYWLVPVPDGATPQMEREIVERSIRPYGILIQEVKEDLDERGKTFPKA